MSVKTLQEEFVARLNANVFMAEFAFAGSSFSAPGGRSVELADHLVLLDEIGLLFQLKERDAKASKSPEDFEKWFDNKVLGKAVKQVRSTRELLSEFRGIRLPNLRGHILPISPPDPAKLAAIVIYGFGRERPPRLDTHKQSRSAGFVHILSDVDYLGMCQFLATPTEIWDYLAFREKLLKGRPPRDPNVREDALIGQYMSEAYDADPDPSFAQVLPRLIQDANKWDISWLTHNLGDQIAYSETNQVLSETTHYSILAELAKLSRTELRAFKERMVLATDALREDKAVLPYRFACPRTDCGFMLLPLRMSEAQAARKSLTVLSAVSKYDFQTRKHVSLSLVRKPPYIDIEWMFMDGPFVQDDRMDEGLRDHYPFRPISERRLPRYSLRDKKAR